MDKRNGKKRKNRREKMEGRKGRDLEKRRKGETSFRERE